MRRFSSACGGRQTNMTERAAWRRGDVVSRGIVDRLRHAREGVGVGRAARPKAIVAAVGP